MFNIRLVIPDREDVYLPTDVDMPLYTAAVDEQVFNGYLNVDQITCSSFCDYLVEENAKIYA